MSEMLVYNTFFSDQLESEEINAENILNMLKNVSTAGNST
jgi:hypothetical protein